ncbi:MAG: transposase family protein [Saprospiraceae bacterium]|nr:transposase family protein [Saprospiraceae bacterium]
MKLYYQNLNCIIKEKNNETYEDYIFYLKQNTTVDNYPKLDTLEKVLSLVLYKMKQGPTDDVLGVVFELSGTVAKNYFNKYTTLLEELLEKKTNANKAL